jgi:probable phosphoglycerate mutase
MSESRPNRSGYRISFVRHGESVANVRGVWQGHGDAPLSALGREQAAALGARLAASRFDLIESSDLSRAFHTSQSLGVPVVTNPAFREIDLGAWEGLTREEVAMRFPDEVRALRAGQAIRIGGAESWDDLYLRTKTAIEALRARLEAGQHAVVFSHGGVVSTVFAALLGVRDRMPRSLGHVVNTAWSTALFDGPRVLIERYNDGTHHPSACPWIGARFHTDDTILTHLAWPLDVPAPEKLPVALAEHWLGEVTRVYTAGEALAPVGLRLAESLGVPHIVDPGATRRGVELGRTHPGTRILVVARPEDVRDAAAQALEPRNGQWVGFATPPPWSLTHVVIARFGAHLRDYAVGPMPVIER